jgi:hypothetical protein
MTVDGFEFKVTKQGGRVTFDGDKILAEMGEDWVKAHQKAGEDFWQVNITIAGKTAEEEKS